MALTQTPVAFYLYEDGMFERIRGLPLPAPEGSCVHVAYEGCARGHFSRMLSAADWDDIDAQRAAVEEMDKNLRNEVGHDDASTSTSDTDTRDGDASSAESGEERCPAPKGCPATLQGGAASSILDGTSASNAAPASEATAAAAVTESEGEWENASDISDDSDMFNVAAIPNKDFVTTEDLRWERCARLATLLRDRPLLPADPRDTTRAYTDLSSGTLCEILAEVFRFSF